MILGGLATVLAAAWKFLGVGKPQTSEAALDSLYALGRRIRKNRPGIRAVRHRGGDRSHSGRATRQGGRRRGERAGRYDIERDRPSAGELDPRPPSDAGGAAGKYAGGLRLRVTSPRRGEVEAEAQRRLRVRGLSTQLGLTESPLTRRASDDVRRPLPYGRGEVKSQKKPACPGIKRDAYCEAFSMSRVEASHHRDHSCQTPAQAFVLRPINQGRSTKDGIQRGGHHDHQRQYRDTAAAF